MAVADQEPNELEKLLADVQRTIRDNDLFLCSLKKEAVDSATLETEEDTGDGNDSTDDYEEL